MIRHSVFQCAPRRPRVDRSRASSGRNAYTLLELLIVGVLITVLMAGVWSLMRNWSGLYARGELRTQRMQLVRSLCDQFTDDVHAAAQTGAARPPDLPPPEGAPPPVPGPPPPSPYAGLTGGADWLMLEVVEPTTPWQGQPSERTSDATAELTATPDSFRDAGPVAPEVHRVVYTFAPPETEVGDGLSSKVEKMAAADDTELVGGEEEPKEPFSGLLRLAVAYESPLMSSGAGGGGAGRMGGGSRDQAFRMRESVVGGAQGNADALDLQLNGPPAEALGNSRFGNSRFSSPATDSGLGGASTTDVDPLAGVVQRDEVPEVSWLELRYFDGASWQSSWNSQLQGRLPVAVELRFELKMPELDKPKRAVSGDEETELVGEPASPSDRANDRRAGSLGSRSMSMNQSAALRGEESTETPYFRCVVFLQGKDRQ